MNQNVCMALDAMQSGIDQMLSSGTCAVLRFKNKQRELTPADCERLILAKKRIAKLRNMVNQKRIADFGMETICGCTEHVRHLEEVGIVTLQDFVRSDPLLIKFALRNVERRKVPLQLHLYVLLVSKAKIIGAHLEQLMSETEPAFFMRESSRG